MPDYKVAFWNVENLFGPEDHPHRIDWIASRIEGDLKGWTQEPYDTKLQQLARIIGLIDADILGVCEVEDAYVLADLVAAVAPSLPDRDYGVIHVDSPEEKRGVDTAFLYDRAKFSVDDTLIFSHFDMRRTGTRDIRQATFRSVAHGQDLVVLANHWPSRSGGAAESAGFRAVAAETLGYWHERIREETGKETAVSALGDFNDDPWDASITFNARGTRERGDVQRAGSARFYNFAWEYLRFDATDHKGGRRRLDGTLYYRNNGNVFDQILASPSLVKTRDTAFRALDGTARVEAFPEMVDHRVSLGPRRFGLPGGNSGKNADTTGFSDHFPVSVVLRETDVGA